MRTQTQASPDDIDLSSLWSVMKRNATRIITVSAVMGLGTFGILLLVPSRYTSETKIQVGGPGINNPFRDMKPGNNPSPEAITVTVDKEAVASQVQFLQSPDLANKLAKDMQLAKIPEFNSELNTGLVSEVMRMAGLAGPREGETVEERVLAAYFKALRVFQVKESRVITVEFSATDSALAATAANRLIELYQDELRNRRTNVPVAAEKWLKPRIAELEKEVAAADAEVERFRTDSDIRKGATPDRTLDDQRLQELTTEVGKVQAARSEAESRARTARELMQRGSVDAIPEVQKSPVIQALIAQRTRVEREKAEADTSLLAGHPRMKQLNANVADIRRQVTKEATAIVDGLDREAKGLALREELATKSLREAKTQVSGKSVDNVKLSSLVGQAKAKRAELESLQVNYQDALSKKQDIATIEAQVIATARPSSTPSSPKRGMLSLLASAAGLILGFALVILKELFVGSRRGGPMQAGAGMTEPGFAPVSMAPQAAPAAARTIRTPAAPAPAVRAPASAAPGPMPDAGAAPSADSASIEAIARRLAGNAQGQGGYRTVITGSAAGVQTHEEALDLAAALIASGKQVAIVDWSFDGQGLSQPLGLNPQPGLMDLLDGRASFEDVIRRLPDAEVHIVPCGTPQPGAKLNADRINLVLDALDEAYDHIIVTGEHAAIRDLFQTIQGRFDAGVVVADPRYPTAAGEAGDGIFLGFQVTEIDVLRIDRGDNGPGRRKMQLARSASPEARI